MPLGPTLARRTGVSRGEVLVVLVCAGIGVTFALQHLLQSQVTARRFHCEQRLTKLGQSLSQFEAIQGWFPGFQNEQAVDRAGNRVPTGWAFPLLPFLEDDRLPPVGAGPQAESSSSNPAISYRQLFADFSTVGEAGSRGERPRRRLPELACPAVEAGAVPRLNYVANCGMPDAESSPYDWPANGIFLNHFLEPDVTVARSWVQAGDGEDFTLLLSENVDAGSWTDGTEAEVGFVWRAELENGEPTPGPDLLKINQLRGKGDRSIRFARPSSQHRDGVNSLFVSGR